MRLKQVIGLALAIAMIATVFSPAVSAAGESKGIDLNASVKEPKPEIAITVDVESIDFGELLPGETSASYPVSVTNIGLKTLDVTADVEDDGSEAIFVAGITVNGGVWSEYSSQLASDDSDSFDVALQIPETATTRGDISGSLTVWAEAIETPVAEFSASPLSSLTPLAIKFTDLSANAPTSWLWNFGDGNTSLEQSPAHTYSAAGTYSISLAVSNYAGSDTETKTVTVKLNIYSTGMENTNSGAPDAGIPGFIGSDGAGIIDSNSSVNPIFTAWASKVINYSPSIQAIQPQWNDPTKALGPVTGDNFDIVSLGDLDQAMMDAENSPGLLILGFDVVITNGPGPDFAAFENGFIVAGTTNVFAELGYMEVSTDGITFARFPSISLTPEQVGGYGNVDPTNVYNLVGKHVCGYGTPFDLSDLVDEPAVLNGSVDLNNINYVRIVDIPGNGYYIDSQGRPIYDAWVTMGSGGVDFEALGVINAYPKASNADYSADVTTGIAPLTVHFTDQSTGATSWAWDFDNDGNVDSNEQNPMYTYETPGTYAVKLTVSNSNGSDQVIRGGFITVNVPPIDDLLYSSDGTSITITGYTGPGGNVVIPNEIDGLPITTIGNSAFKNCAALTSVTIGKHVTIIDDQAFYRCTALTSVAMGSGVTTIGTYSFSQTGITSIILPEGVTNLGNNAFRGCTALTSLVIPDSVTTIGTYAFYGCTALTSATIGHGVTDIPNYAFYGCTALTSATIGHGVTGIGNWAFSGCTDLISLTIPDNVITIRDSGFQNCIGLVSVTLSNGIVSIGQQAFYGCTALTSVTMPDSVTTIGSSAFSGCTGLTSITIGHGVTGIGNSAFYQCTALTSVTIPSSVTSIGDGAFSDCTALTSINVDTGSNAFISVDGVLYNKDMTTLMKCPEMKAGLLIIPDSVTTIGQQAFYGCTALTSVTIPGSVTTIGQQAFSGCSALTSVEIPNNVTTIGSNAFARCTALASATIGRGVATIGQRAFNDCTALTAAVFQGNAPATVASNWAQGSAILVAYYQEGASGFTTPIWQNVPCYPAGAPTAVFSANIVAGTTPLAVTFTHTGTGANAFAWDFDNDGITDSTVKTPSYIFGTPGMYTISLTVSNPWGNDTETKVAYINATTPRADGLVYTNDSFKVTIIGYNGPGGDVVIPSEIDGLPVTAIANSAFSGKTAVTSVTIPDSVTSIGTNAFQDCIALTTVEIGSGITSFNNNVFSGCTALTTVNVDANNTAYTSIDGVVYDKAVTSLMTCPPGKTSVTIPDCVTGIPNNAFQNCKDLASVTIGSGVTAIPNYAFAGCTALTSITIPSTVTAIGNYAFDGCSALSSVDLGGGVKTIGNYAFRNCVALTSITIPSNVTAIGNYAFDGDGALASMVFSGNTPTVGANWIRNCPSLVIYYLPGATGFTNPWQGRPCYPAIAPTAEFSASVVSGFAPLTVQFADQSANGPQVWSWDFDGDGVADSFEQNPSWTFSTPGTYTVTLSVSNPFGNDTVVKTAFITVTAEPPASDWAYFQGNQQLNGYYVGNAPDSNDLKWVSDAIDAWPSSSVVIAEGKVFVYCYNETDEKAYIAALYVENGTIAWIKPMLTNPLWDSWATPAYHDGLVFTAGDTARYASNGTIAWPDGRTVGTESTTNGGPMIAEGKVFVGDWDGHHYFAYDEKTGAQVWQFTVPGYAQGTPSYHDGKLFVTSWTNPGGNIYCLNAADGTLVWHNTTALDTCGSPAIAGGYVYVTTYNFGGDGDLYCFYESNGTQVWTQKIQRTDSTPAVYDGKVYVTGGCYGVSPHQTYCFDAFDGTPIWSTDEEEDIGGWTSSVVIADGKLFVGREGSWGEGGSMRFGYIGLFALDIEDGDVLWEAENGGATVAIYGGVVFTAGIDGRMYAYGPTEAVPSP